MKSYWSGMAWVVVAAALMMMIGCGGGDEPPTGAQPPDAPATSSSEAPPAESPRDAFASPPETDTANTASDPPATGGAPTAPWDELADAADSQPEPTPEPSTVRNPFTSASPRAPEPTSTRDASTESPADDETGDDPNATPFKITRVVQSQMTGRNQRAIYFADGKAVEFVSGVQSRPSVVYDLVAGGWTEVDQGRYLKLGDVEALVRARADETRKRADEHPDPQVRRFAVAVLDPLFDVEDTEQGLRLTNELIFYEVRSQRGLEGRRATWYFMFETLDAYREALATRQAPNPHLAVIEQLRQRGMFPNEMNVTMQTPSGGVRVQMQTAFSDVTEAERARLDEVLSAEY